MHKGRLEAFTDAVIAIIMTIMVLELRPPHLNHMPTWADLGELRGVFLSYLLSFVFLAIYWNNHHHMFQSVEKIDGGVLWANMHLLLWLSLTVFVTAWLGEGGLSTTPVACYGIVLFFSGVAYYILVQALLKANGRNSHFAKALGSDTKGKISPLIYLVAIAFAFFLPIVSCILYAAVAAMWLVPDKRFVRKELPAEHS